MESEPEREGKFFAELEKFLLELPIQCHACVIHRPGYNARYEGLYGKDRWKLCKSAYTILVERAAKIAQMNDRKLVVYVEQTGKREDRSLREYHAHIRDAGMYFNAQTSSKYGPLDGASFAQTTMKKPRFVTKANPMVQIADLVLYPLVKGRYDPNYRPFKRLSDAGRIVDSHLTDEQRGTCGVKYYCFD